MEKMAKDLQRLKKRLEKLRLSSYNLIISANATDNWDDITWEGEIKVSTFPSVSCWTEVTKEVQRKRSKDVIAFFDDYITCIESQPVVKVDSYGTAIEEPDKQLPTEE